MKPRPRQTKATLAATRPADKQVYADMLMMATTIVVRNRGKPYHNGELSFMEIEFPYWVKMKKDFPRGNLISKTDYTNIYKVNAVKLLNWLYANGHSEYNTPMLTRRTKQFEYFEGEIERMVTNEII